MRSPRSWADWSAGWTRCVSVLETTNIVDALRAAEYPMAIVTSSSRRTAAAKPRASSRGRGVPRRAAVGIAISPDDGTDAASLVAHADEGVFAARAAGVDLA